ncbi:MAG: M48 family metallopeptidase [Pseudomonas sp.]|uniref:M48 family metallopeptidase n=1 Tax=Pseudomonas sp. TaxID=306 RepID=UPI00273513F5|nr:M48 family metallopeptidase [Pseudomonas sp.]MDP3846870.1 M48 family metallopeptidase [Pseudomonas sp.]
MNFFEHQARAKRNSGRLVLLLGLAVICLVTLTSLTLMLLLQLFGEVPAHSAESRIGLDWSLIGLIAATVIAVVLLGSLYKSAQLSKGGKAVAERLGGRLINLAPQSPEERRVLNVVEEMAIASGTPVPPVYLLDDPGINAFAAGLTPQDAVIGITRGAIFLLSRDELQGVIAHEFSHIFHGDMRLNTRLVAVLHGILLLGLIGGQLLDSDSNRHTRVSISSSVKNNSGVALSAIGCALWVLGYAGTFFGNLIKAAVSRQREFLADAAAVQFTRNDQSIAGALKKIGGYACGSQLRASHAAEFSHMYFGPGISLAFGSLMATHPPLEERIRRVEPRWDGSFPQVVLPAEAYGNNADAAAPVSADWDAAISGLSAAPNYSPQAAEHAIEHIGEPQAAHLNAARNSLQRLAEPLKAAAHHSLDAQALVYGLLLSREEPHLSKQLDLLRPRLNPDIAQVLQQLQGELSRLDADLRLPLLELAIPALKQLDRQQFTELKKNLVLLAQADQVVNLMEWSLFRILERSVQGPRPIDGQYRLSEMAAESAVLLSALAHAGHDDPKFAAQALAKACAALPFEPLTLAARSPALKSLDAALKRLSQLLPLQKPRLLKAMAICIAHDGRINAAEAELMRAVADTLDCPMPPLLSD